MLPTLEQCDTARKSFPRGRVDARHACTVPSPALAIGSRTDAGLVDELDAVTRPTSFLTCRSWREVGAAGGSRSGRGSP